MASKFPKLKFCQNFSIAKTSITKTIIIKTTDIKKILLVINLLIKKKTIIKEINTRKDINNLFSKRDKISINFKTTATIKDNTNNKIVKVNIITTTIKDVILKIKMNVKTT